jgi:hypothetical protein
VVGAFGALVGADRGAGRFGAAGDAVDEGVGTEKALAESFELLRWELMATPGPRLPHPEGGEGDLGDAQESETSTNSRGLG